MVHDSAVSLDLPYPLSPFCVSSHGDSPWLELLPVPLALAVGKGSLVVYSDGSLQETGSATCHGGTGFMVLDGDRSLWEVALHLGGWMSSTKMEIYVHIAALASLPVSYPVQIFTDSQGLIYGYHAFVAGGYVQSFHHLLWNRFYHEWSILCSIVSCCSAPVILSKVVDTQANFGRI